MCKGFEVNKILQEAREVLYKEANSILALMDRLDESFIKAVELIYNTKGRIVVTGIGKSGLISKKLAATFSSTGTPAFFLHPADAIHGDLGMIMRDDLVLAISNSGENEEIKHLLPFIKRFNLFLISITGNILSTLAEYSDVILDISIQEEACPFDLVPTVSTTVSLALGDALAIALLKKKGFKIEDFALFHPGGVLGKKLSRVSDLMHAGSDVPVVDENDLMPHVLYEMTIKRLGMTCVTDKDGKLAGVVTDGDLRRLLERVKQKNNDINLSSKDIMTKDPKIIKKNNLTSEAVELMERYSITSLIIIDEDQKPIGVIHLHDLLKAGVV